jgi:hypothetical protein
MSWRGTNCGENEAKQKAADLNIMFDPGEIRYRVVGTNLPTRALAARVGGMLDDSDSDSVMIRETIADIGQRPAEHLERTSVVACC